MSNFEGVVPVLADALARRGYDKPTPVQEAVLDPDLADRDALVSAQTGSGKTVAFGIAMAPNLLGGSDRLDRAETPLALAVAPTRELALQVKRELQWLYSDTGAIIASCVGGMDMRTERRALERGAHIVVGTPGRLRDHIERASFDPSGLKAVVLDEADEMLDLGFRDDLEFILDASPTDRRTLLFSATVPRSIEHLAKRYQRNAARINVASAQKQHVDIDYRALSVAPSDQENAIVNVLRYYDAKNALVFCATRVAVNHMTSRFNNRGFSVVALSGELSQNERTHALQALRDGRAKVCIATDVAARGIDLPNLELVIHADIPKTKETLLHRSGRTGRAGRKGVCALIVPHNWRKRTERLLSNANVTATWQPAPSVDDILTKDRERLLSDPALGQELDESEQAFASDLLAKYSPEQIAAAFLRQRFEGQAAPEELLDIAPPQAPKQRRADFTDGVWFSLSVGRDQSAEPRWLLPLICRNGHITKNEIGAIRIQATETFFELTPACVDAFVKQLGPDAVIEQNIRITRLDTPPAISQAPAPKSRRPAPPRERQASRPSDRKDRTPAPARSRAAKSRAAKPRPAQIFEEPVVAPVEPTRQDDRQNQPRPASPGKRPDKGSKAKPKKPKTKAKAKGRKKFTTKPAGKSSGKPPARPKGNKFKRSPKKT